jgi:hypothetical protein
LDKKFLLSFQFKRAMDASYVSILKYPDFPAPGSWPLAARSQLPEVFGIHNKELRLQSWLNERESSNNS